MLELCKENINDKFCTVIFADEKKINLCRTTQKNFLFLKGEYTPIKPKTNPND